MTISKLEKARRDVAATNAAIAEARAGEDAAAQAVARAQAALATARTKVAAQQAKLVERERTLGEAEQEALDEYAIELAARIIKMQATDPRRYRDRVIEGVTLLRRATRTRVDWPINRAYVIEPLVVQALALVPPPDPVHTPVNELGRFGVPWEQRRRQLIAEFESTDEPQAA